MTVRGFILLPDRSTHDRRVDSGGSRMTARYRGEEGPLRVDGERLQATGYELDTEMELALFRSPHIHTTSREQH